MRVLLTTRGSSGHVTPLAPFGHALVRAGHEVLVAAQEHFEENVARTGLPFAPVGAPRPEDWMPLLPEFAQLRLDEGHDRMVAEFFGTIDVRAMLPGLRRVADEWRPDLIVRESWEYGSTIVAEERGIPLARVGLGTAGRGGRVGARRRPGRRRGTRRRRAPRRSGRRACCGRRPTSPICRRRSRTRASRRRRGRCASARAEVPAPAVPDAEPLVYVSFGSVTAGAHLPLYPALYRAAIEALAPLPARILLTVGEDRDHGELGPLPPNVTVERWVPQDEVLAHAAAVVTHGGHGSTLGALAHGVPCVVLPLFALDQWFNAAAVARAGAGVALDGERHTRRAIDLPSAETLAALRPAVEHVLTDPGPRDGARRIADGDARAARRRRGTGRALEALG